MLRKLDRYIITSFLPDFFVSAFALSGIFVVVDLFQRLGDFIDLQFTQAFVTVCRYYALFVPINIPEMFPAITLIGAGMTLVRYSRANALLAMKASGVSIFRIMVPLFGCACALAGAATLNREYVVPRLWIRMDRLQRELRDQVLPVRRRIEDPANNMQVWVWEFDRKKRTMKTIDIWQYYDSGALRYWIKAERGEWRGKEWRLFDVTKHDFAEDDRHLGTKKLQTYVIGTSLEPKDLEAVTIEPAALKFGELRELCRTHPDVHSFQVNLHDRVVYPLKPLVLLLIGVPLLIGFDGLGRSRFLGILYCVIVCAVFYATGFVSSHFGLTGRLHPILAAWTPTVMFGAAGMLMFDNMRT